MYQLREPLHPLAYHVHLPFPITPGQKEEEPTQHIKKQNKTQEEIEKGKEKEKESDGVQVLREIRR